MDAVSIKSRMFMILGVIFALVNINNVCNLIFGNWNQGVILFKYTIQENNIPLWKRSVRRSYTYKYAVSMTGIYTLFKDETRIDDLCHGNLYRETGTASKKAEQKPFVKT